MNKPYVKEYNALGEVSNPITKSNPYISGQSQRSATREIYNKVPFHGTGKNFPLTVTKNAKYLRFTQIERDKEGNRKVILHYYER